MVQLRYGLHEADDDLTIWKSDVNHNSAIMVVTDPDLHDKIKDRTGEDAEPIYLYLKHGDQEKKGIFLRSMLVTDLIEECANIFGMDQLET